MMKRFKNYGFLVSMAALLGLFFNDAGWLSPEQYKTYVDAILAVLIAAGITNNPSQGKGFGDK